MFCSVPFCFSSHPGLGFHRYEIRLASFCVSFPSPIIAPDTGGAVAQGVESVAKKLITSYSAIKKEAKCLRVSERKHSTSGGHGAAGREFVKGEAGDEEKGGGEKDWDLDLTLTVVEFQRARLERARLAGTR